MGCWVDLRMVRYISLLLFIGLAYSQFNYQLEENIPYYDDDNNIRCELDIYYPENKKDFPTIVWFHGGGLKAGNKYIADRLKNQEVAIISANYRFFPIVSTKQVISDAAAAVAWAFNNINDYGGNEKLIFVSGHSAGGYLTSMVGLDKSWLAKYKIDSDKIAGLIPFSGHAITHFTVREEMGITDRNKVIVDSMAPLYHVRKNAPPYVIITGNRDLELLGRYEENAYMARMMRLTGHQSTIIYELDGYGHSMVEPALPLLLKFLKEQTRKILEEENN